MSTITRDYLSPARARQAGASATYEMFKKAWGTTTVNGVEVFNARMYYYTGAVRSDVRFKRFINKIGIQYEQLRTQNYDGLDNAYFYLNSSKYSYTPMDKPAIADDLSNAFAVGDEFEVAVTYGGDLKRYVTGTWSENPDGSYSVDTVAIRAMLNSDKVKYFANASLESAGSQFQEEVTSIYDIQVGTNKTGKATPVTKLAYNDDDTANGKLYDVLALLDDGTTFQQQGDVYTERISGVKTTDQYGNVNIVGEYSYIIKYKVIAPITVYSYIVDQCSVVAHAVDASLKAVSLFGKTFYQSTNHAQDTLIKQAVLLMDNPATNSAFYMGYLRVDYCASIKRKEFVKILSKCFDSGYTKKKVKWWKKAIAIVIIIIAIVIIVLTWWTGVGTGAGAALAALGTGLMYASVFLTISLMLYASAFPEATSEIRMIGTAAQIVGYASIVVGVYNGITVAYVMAAVTAAQELGLIDAKTAMVINALAAAYGATSGAGLTLDNLSQMDMGQMLTVAVKSLPGDMSGWIKLVSTGMNLYNSFLVTPFELPTNSDASQKEEGVETYYASIAMMDNTDILDRMSRFKDGMFGGEQTMNYLSTIG